MALKCSLSKREGLRCLRRQIETLAHLTSLDRSSASAIHDLRISCRRGRVMLAEFKDNFPPAARRATRRLLRKTGRSFGRVREVDASLSLLERWATGDRNRTLALAAIRRQLEDERQAANAYENVSCEEIAEAFAGLEESFIPSTACHLRHARKRLRKRLKRLRQQYRAWCASQADDDLHLLRIRFKMLRYTLEVHRDLYGKHSKEFLHTLGAAQDALGRWNDCRQLRDRVRDAAGKATPEAREGIAALAAAVESDTAACVASIDDHLKPIFAKDEFRRSESMLAAPKRTCCHGAR